MRGWKTITHVRVACTSQCRCLSFRGKFTTEVLQNSGQTAKLGRVAVMLLSSILFPPALVCPHEEKYVQPMYRPGTTMHRCFNISMFALVSCTTINQSSSCLSLCTLHHHIYRYTPVRRQPCDLLHSCEKLTKRPYINITVTSKSFVICGHGTWGQKQTNGLRELRSLRPGLGHRRRLGTDRNSAQRTPIRA